MNKAQATPDRYFHTREALRSGAALKAIPFDVDLNVHHYSGPVREVMREAMHHEAVNARNLLDYYFPRHGGFRVSQDFRKWNGNGSWKVTVTYVGV